MKHTPYSTDVDKHEFTIEPYDIHELETIIKEINNIDSLHIHHPSGTLENTILSLSTQDYTRIYNIKIYNHDRIVAKLELTSRLTRENKKEYNIYMFFFGLTQYNADVPTHTNLCISKRSGYETILSYLDKKKVSVRHTAIDISVDYTGLKYDDIDIIKENGVYRVWDSVEIRQRNRYSVERTVVDGKHARDNRFNTQQVILNVYDKSNKGGYGYNMVRVEYKLCKRGLDRSGVCKVDGRYNYILYKDVVMGMLQRYRVLSIEDRDSVMEGYASSIGDGDRGVVYRRRLKYSPVLLDDYELRMDYDVIYNVIRSKLIYIMTESEYEDYLSHINAT